MKRRQYQLRTQIPIGFNTPQYYLVDDENRPKRNFWDSTLRRMSFKKMDNLS